MSAIIKRFDVKLTRNQTDQIEQEWKATHKEFGRVMLAIQPLGESFRSQYDGPPILRIAFLDSTLGDAMQRLIKRHKKARP